MIISIATSESTPDEAQIRIRLKNREAKRARFLEANIPFIEAYKAAELGNRLTPAQSHDFVLYGRQLQEHDARIAKYKRQLAELTAGNEPQSSKPIIKKAQGITFVVDGDQKPLKAAPLPKMVEGKLNPDDVRLVERIGSPLQFNRAYKSHSRPAMVAYMTAAYNKANKAFFDGRLKKPNLELTRAVDAAKFKGRGKYVYGPRRLLISPTLFNPGVEALVLTTIIHEMCHQAVYELDGVRPPQLNVDGGHGAEWAAWMHRCGLQPQRYDTYDNKMYLDPKKQALLADRSAALAKATDTEDRIASSDITVGMQVVLKASGQVFIGLVYKLPINGKVQVLCPRERSEVAVLYSVPDDICFRPKQSLTPFFSTKFMLYAAKLGLSR